MTVRPDNDSTFAPTSGGTAAPPSATLQSKGTAAPPSVPRCVSRRHPAHTPNVERFNQPVILFLTVCANERRPVLACERVHAALTKVWPQALQYCVGRYVLMPDHLHLFCAPAVRDPENVSRWAAYWKRLASLELKELAPLWQRDCWDTQLRQGESYTDKWAYVRNNPVRAGLVGHAEDWPYQGSLNELLW